MIDRALIYRAGTCVHAVPLAAVIEVMRPLPIERLQGSFAFTRGVAIIRGEPTPVIDLAELSGEEVSEPTRFVTIRAGERRIAILADEILGIRALPAGAQRSLPPLLGSAEDGVIRAIGVADAALLLVLEEMRLVPDAVWEAMDRLEVTT